nr:hypothetical protein [uncultured Undibacterium sp.]
MAHTEDGVSLYRVDPRLLCRQLQFQAVYNAMQGDPNIFLSEHSLHSHFARSQAFNPGGSDPGQHFYEQQKATSTPDRNLRC